MSAVLFFMINLNEISIEDKSIYIINLVKKSSAHTVNSDLLEFSAYYKFGMNLFFYSF